MRASVSIPARVAEITAAWNELHRLDPLMAENLAGPFLIGTLRFRPRPRANGKVIPWKRK
jgi:hypothetical protein